MTQDPPESGHSNEHLTEPLAKSVTYGSYLKVKPLLELQEPLSRPEQHDETLFIIIHQVYELWFKQILHEVKLAEQVLARDQLMPFIRILKRITTIQSVLTHQVDVLETMTPVDFNRFRSKLNPASGFQSWQFRELEFRLGAKDPGYMKFHKLDATATAALEAALHTPSVYDRFLQALSRRGFAISDKALKREVTAAYETQEDVREAVLKIYRESDKYYDLYSTLEALIDMDEGVLLWRQRHVVMVERMIGNRSGTGGSSGVKYLSSTLVKRFFPEIWEARSWLGDTGYGQGFSPS